MRALQDFLHAIQFRLLGKWLFLGGAVGIVAGLGAVLFHWLLGVISHWALGQVAGVVMPVPAGEGGGPEVFQFSVAHRWLLLVIPTIGGLISGFLIYTFAPEAEGHGTDAVIEAFHRRGGLIRPIVPIIKVIASAITIGTGGSAGREGPIAQIGAGFGSVLARVLRLPVRDRRILTIAGVGGGIGAIFRAPLGGALFSVEVLYSRPDFESDAVVPSIISAIFAYSIFGLVYSFTPIFSTHPYRFSVVELPFFGLLGLVLVPFGFVYVRVFYGVRDLFRAWQAPNHIKPMVGGLLLGLILMAFPYVMGTSYGWLQLALLGKLTLGLLIGIALLKILATALTIGSGGSGGVFAPSLVIGAMLGGAFGVVMQHLFPALIHDSTPFALVGMGSFFAAVAKVPLSTLVMVAEMTGNYDLLVPMTLSMSLAYLFSGRWSIYESQVPSRVDSPAHQGEFLTDILEDILVKDAAELPVFVPHFPQEMPIQEALRRAAETRFHCFPVVDKKGNLRGFLYADDLRSILFSGEMGTLSPILIVGDIAQERVPTLKPTDNLQKALSEFIKTGYEELPVVDEQGKCIGVLSRRDLMSAYDRELLRRRRLVEEEEARPVPTRPGAKRRIL